jgi:NAD-dependent deacetylase
MRQLAELIKNSEHCVVMTGAGISTLSGIKDFRGKNGVYKSSSIDADKIFSLDYFRKDPSYYYKNTKDFIYNIDEKEPGIVHRVLARLEQRGVLKAVITQNIDMLHQKAGSKNVFELHGSPAIHKCLRCGKTFTYQDIAAKVKAGIVPQCDACSGTIKPEIIFFGEMLNEATIDGAINEAGQADLMLVLGSTLVVNPAASIPLYTLDNGGRLVIINDMETPLDRYAVLRYHDLKETFDWLAANFDACC